MHAAILPRLAALAEAAEVLARATSPALVVGDEVDAGGSWHAAVALAERRRMPAYAAPASHRASFPEEHPLFAGFLPAAPAALAQALAGFDALLVAGAPVFTFHVEGHCALFDPGGPAIWRLTARPGGGGQRRHRHGHSGRRAPCAGGACRGAAAGHRPMPAGRTRPRARAARRRYADGRAGAAARGAVDAG